MEPDSETLTSYDAYGQAVETMECWYDVHGFNVDAGDFFGVVTYVYDSEDDTLTDDLGNVEYVRTDPVDPADAPVTREALLGAWHKRGDTDESYEHIVLEEDGYKTLQLGIETGYGAWTLSEVTGYYNDSEYIGPAVDFEVGSGFLNADPWVLEGGRVLYDAFHEEYYIREGLSEDECAVLREKYDMIIDGWQNGENSTVLGLNFFGEIWFFPNDGNMPTAVGHWELSGDTLLADFGGGEVQETTLYGSLVYDGMTYSRDAVPVGETMDYTGVWEFEDFAARLLVYEDGTWVETDENVGEVSRAGVWEYGGFDGIILWLESEGEKILYDEVAPRDEDYFPLPDGLMRSEGYGMLEYLGAIGDVPMTGGFEHLWGVWESVEAVAMLEINQAGQVWYVMNGELIFRGYLEREEGEYILCDESDLKMFTYHHNEDAGELLEFNSEGAAMDTYIHQGTDGDYI